MAWRTKLIIDVTIEVIDQQRAQYKWDNIMEKIKYQYPNVKISQQLEPNWMEVTDELDPNQSTG